MSNWAAMNGSKVNRTMDIIWKFNIRIEGGWHGSRRRDSRREGGEREDVGLTGECVTGGS